MSNPEFGPQSQVDYISIGEKLASGEQVNTSEREVVYSVAMEYVKGLMEEKSSLLFGLSSKSQGVKDYLEEVVLGRLLRLHNNAIQNNIAESDAISRFGELKDKICERFSIKADLVQDEALSNFLYETVDEHLDPSDEVLANMKFIQETGSKIILNNPSVESKGIEHKLD